MKVHYTHPYFLNPQHRISVNLIGLGGTGSQVLTCLGRINAALVGLGHVGLHVTCWDDDVVSYPNIGRQMFSQSDIGLNKSVVLVNRINAFYGTDWVAKTSKFNQRSSSGANITISCIDSAEGRIKIHDVLKLKCSTNGNHPSSSHCYWLDFGNLKTTGQIILGTAPNVYVRQPKKSSHTVSKLPHVVKMFPQLKKIKEADQGPSCSMAQAINKQDLFINSTLAQIGTNLIWKLFREGIISVHGAYVNLETLTVNPIKIK